MAHLVERLRPFDRTGAKTLDSACGAASSEGYHAAVRRRLLNLLTALSLVLCVAVCVLWARSFFLAVAYRFPYHGELCEVVLNRGRVGVNNAPEVVGQAMIRRGRRPGAPPAT